MKRKLKYLITFILITLSISCVLWLKNNNNKHGIIIFEDQHYEDKENILLDLNDFKYLLKGNSCQNNVTYLQIVTSFSGNVEARSAIRQAYPSSLLKELGIVRIFLLGLLTKSHKTDVTQKAIENEYERFHDLVQGNFIESYRNLTYKHIMGLKWGLTYCPNISAMIKMDDDILVDLFSLTTTIKQKDFALMGYVLKNMRPIRIKANKWYVSKEEYEEDSYPPFLSGWMYVVSSKAIKKLLSATRHVKFFWIDDLWVTGILAKEAHVSQTNISFLFTLHPEVVECCLRRNLTCDFIVAPSGGDNSLQIIFKQHSELCFRNPCPTVKTKIEDICVSQRKIPQLKQGFPQLTMVKL